MPTTEGWDRPDWQAMQGEALREHLKTMGEIGIAYCDLYSTGQWPIPEDKWADWWSRTTPEFRVWFSHSPHKDHLVSELMANSPAMDLTMTAAHQEDVHIHPFPGGCLFEQVTVFTKRDGTQNRMPGVHIFYLNDEGKVVRSHEYYDLSGAPGGGLINE